MSAQSNTARFAKRYRDAAACRTALANYHWLTGIGEPLRLPRLLSADAGHLDFEFVHGRAAVPDDLVALAGHLGDVHSAAHVKELHRARLDTPYATGGGHYIPDFLTPRLQVLPRRLRSGTVPEPWLDVEQAIRLLRQAAAGPAALYKDANPRNFLITANGPIALDIDVDDLTLAPFGYDLAKLIVTLAMTHGPISAQVIEHSLAAYNAAANRQKPGLGHVTWSDLMAWTEIHHILTSPYLGAGGYQHSWHTLRPDAPWASPVTRAAPQRTTLHVGLAIGLALQSAHGP
ncbi:MAG: phosphotransferase [Egibacteraceae bacterium]